MPKYNFMKNNEDLKEKIEKENEKLKEQQLREKGSEGAKRIRKFLNYKNVFFIEEYSFFDLYDVRTLKYDFALFSKRKTNKIPVLLIEFQGEQHYKHKKRFHKTKEEYLKQLEHDEMKREYCKKNHIPLIEIKYDEVNQIEEILKSELKKLEGNIKKGPKEIKKIRNFLIKNKLNFREKYYFADLTSDVNHKLDYLKYDFAIFDENNNLTNLIYFKEKFPYKRITLYNSLRVLEKEVNDMMMVAYCKVKEIPLIEIKDNEFDNIEDILDKELKKYGLKE